MPDQTLMCKDCQTPFTFSERDQNFYTERGFTPPKRCRSCREEKKQRQASHR